MVGGDGVVRMAVVVMGRGEKGVVRMAMAVRTRDTRREFGNSVDRETIILPWRSVEHTLAPS